MEGKRYKSYELNDYFVRRILTTFDGDTRPDFVDAVQDSRLVKLELIAKLGNKQFTTYLVEPKEKEENQVVTKVLG